MKFCRELYILLIVHGFECHPPHFCPLLFLSSPLSSSARVHGAGVEGGDERLFYVCLKLVFLEHLLRYSIKP